MQTDLEQTPTSSMVILESISEILNSSWSLAEYNNQPTSENCSKFVGYFHGPILLSWRVLRTHSVSHSTLFVSASMTLQ